MTVLVCSGDGAVRLNQDHDPNRETQIDVGDEVGISKDVPERIHGEYDKIGGRGVGRRDDDYTDNEVR